MPYFLSSNNIVPGQPIQFDQDELRHLLLSHRVKAGEQIFVQGPDGKRFKSAVEKIDKKEIVVMPVSQASVPSESKLKITLFQAMVAEKALDFILQKSTELGVAKIILWNAKNTATKLSENQFQNKLGRWNKILWEAAKQSERAVVPELGFAESLNNSMLSKAFDQILVLAAQGESGFPKVPGQNNIGIFVGPEGGLTPAELENLSQAGGVAVSLGQFVLRAETAALAAVSICLRGLPS